MPCHRDDVLLSVLAVRQRRMRVFAVERQVSEGARLPVDGHDTRVEMLGGSGDRADTDVAGLGDAGEDARAKGKLLQGLREPFAATS